MNEIPYGKHHIDAEDIQAVVDVLKSSHITQGKKVKEFESAFSNYVGSSFSLAVSNGTAGLHLAVMALGLKPGEKVITTSNTFVASANCISFEGGEVDFVDIDPTTFLIDIDKLEAKLKNANPKEYSGIVVVDFAGHPLDMERIYNLAKTYGLWVIEDACHATGAKLKDSKGDWSQTGSCKYSDATVFSFHPVKHITSGEGGIITTSSKELADKMESLRSHGIIKSPKLFNGNSHGGWYYEMQDLGYNYRLSDINCALVNSQLKKINTNIERRNEIATFYTNAFSEIKQVITPSQTDSQVHAYHLFVILAERRDELYSRLIENNILVQVHYIPVHIQPYYRKIKDWNKELECTNNYYSNCLSLPMFPTLTQKELDYVMESIKSFYQN